ncbi:hypothetical protein C0989_002872 [Termitomyces sp. Mn162]|nr:hypothetical protein C0989_002872 [Termitomyces sp. Mn162]
MPRPEEAGENIETGTVGNDGAKHGPREIWNEEHDSQWIAIEPPSGWGSLMRMTLTEDDRKEGESRLQEIRRQSVLGQFTASALAGNAVLGSVFYALPAVVVVSSV